MKLEHFKNTNFKLLFKGTTVLDTGTGGLGSSNTNGIRKIDTGKIEEIPTQIICAENQKDWILKYADFVSSKLNDKEESVLAVMPGGQQLDNKGEHYFNPPNICVGNERKLIGKIYVSDVENAIRSNLVQRGIKLTKFKIFNDGVLQGVNAAFMLAKTDKNYINDAKNEGKIIAIAFPGGGLGGTHLEIEKDKIKIIPEETGHLLANNINKDYLYTDQINKINRMSIEEYSCSAPAVIRIFAKSLGFNDKKARILSSTKEGRIVTQNIITLNNNDPEQNKQAEELSKTGLFKELKTDNKIRKFILLKDSKPVDKEDHSKACIEAGTEFFKNIGKLLAYYELSNRCDTILITTKLASNIANTLTDLNINAEEIVKNSAWDELDDSRRNIIGSVENQNVIIKNAGEPCTIKNAETILKGETQGKFRVVEIPKTAFE